jgi:hypothetical protein
MITEMRSQIIDELIKSGVLVERGERGGGGGAGGDVRSRSSMGGYDSPGIKKASHLAALFSASTNSHSVSLIKAALSAGLFPNIARSSIVVSDMQGREQDKQKSVNKIETKSNKKVHIHPSSINCFSGGKLLNASRDKIEWILFDEMSTFGTFGAVSIRGTTVVHPFSLLLLCGEGGRGGVYEELIANEVRSLTQRSVKGVDSRELVDAVEKGLKGRGDEEDEEEKFIAPVCRFGDHWGSLIVLPSIAIQLLLLQKRFERAVYRSVIALRGERMGSDVVEGGDMKEDEASLEVVSKVVAEEVR